MKQISGARNAHTLPGHAVMAQGHVVFRHIMDGSSYGGSTSQASSNGNAKKKKDKRRDAAADGEADLLDEKKSAEEALHASMYALVKEKSADPWQMTAIKTVMEGLVPVLILFNPQRQFWRINEDQWAWKIVRWSVFGSPIVSLYPYSLSTFVLDVVSSVIFLLLAGIGFLAWAMRKGEQSKRTKMLSKVLQFVSELLFTILYMTILDFLLFYFDCSWASKTTIMHVYFNQECFASPHLINLVIAGVTAVVFTLSTVIVQTAGCDLNPCAMGALASPAAVMKIKVVFTKATFILVMNTLTFSPKLQAVLATTCVLYVFWLNCNTMPFLRETVNYAWCGMWLAVLYVSCIYTAMAFSPYNEDTDFLDFMTNLVLYGIWGPLIAGGLISWGWLRYRTRVVAKFRAALADLDAEHAQLRRLHKFSDPHEVELLSRAMRQFDLDGVIAPDAAVLGEVIIKAGLASFPNNPMLLILMANFKMEVQQDGPASRTMLQLVSKHQPNFVERYQVFCTTENSKRLKAAAEQGLDMHSYVEFKRNYRAVLRAHKEALMQVREFWTLLMKNELAASRIEDAMSECGAMVQRAYRVYRRVVERYPTNGRLLKCYGSFLEDVKNDFKGATRVYAEAVRQGGTGNAGALAMDFDFASQQGKPDMLLSMDVNEDAIAIINAEGSIMMVSNGVTPLFGYAKSELEGQNISMLMPPPFNQRHNGYMQHYKETGEVRILDQVKEVVALHKERRVFPVQICVTKLSGMGTDAIFLGLMRAMPFSKRDVRAWVAPNGTILCCGPMFSALTGVAVEDMVGTNMRSLLIHTEGFDRLLSDSMLVPTEEVTEELFSTEVAVRNRYTGQVPAHCFLTMGGTDQNRVAVVHFHRTDEQDENLLVVDESGAVTFATVDLAVTLGYQLKALLKLNLRHLIPAPVNMAHEKWLHDAPPTHPVSSCRAGTIVNMVGANGQLIPVRLRLTQREEPSGLKHIARITKSTLDEMLDDRRVQLIASYDGIIQSVTPENAIFGFPSTLLKGLHVCDVIDIFADWQQKSGSRDMQLLMLALLDKEQEMPGSAWRIKLSHPDNLKLPESEKRLPKSAIFQASLVETKKKQGAGSGGQDSKASLAKGVEGPAGDQGAASGGNGADAKQGGEDEPPRVMLTLWRREVLLGSLELDAALKVRKADLSAGLILGHPASSLLKKPLSSFLRIPRRATWDTLMATNKQKASQARGLLKSTPTTGKISTMKLLEGSHPDGGSMRILVQGVIISDLSGKARIDVTIRPDMTFTAAQSNIWGALGLDFDKKVDKEAGRQGEKEEGRQLQGNKDKAGEGDRRGSDHSSEEDRAPLKASRLLGLRSEGSTGRAVTGGPGEPERGDDSFVKHWVRAISKQDSKALEAGAEAAGPPPQLRLSSKSMRHEPEDAPLEAVDWLKEAEDLPDEAFTLNKVVKQSSSGLRRGGSGVGGGGDGSDARSEHSEGESDAASSVGGDTADNASGFTSSVAGEEEILVDSRRAKLHHKLLTLLQQPVMVSPVNRLKVVTLLIALLMLAARITFFFISQSLVAEQTLVIQEVFNTAIAADRSQVICARSIVLVYCKDLPLAQKVLDSVCNALLDPTAFSNSLRDNIADLDLASQSVYLGRTNKVQRLSDPATYAAWTVPDINMTLYLDTRPVAVTDVQQRSLWELSNRFSANAKELVWQSVYKNASDIRYLPPYNFVEINGATVLFDAYGRALDTLMVYARSQLAALNTNILVLMVLEALVFMPLFMLWQWYLLSKAERTRLVSWMFMLGLPGPVLRTLGSRPIKLGDDSDADSDDDSVAGHPPAIGEAAPFAPPPALEPTHGDAAAALPGGSSMARPVGGAGEALSIIIASRAKPKVIKPSRKYYVRFLLPLVLCFVLLIIVYGITLSNVQQLQAPLAALNMAMHVTYRFSHMRYVAFRSVTRDTDADKRAMIEWLNRTLGDLESEYNTLMYGGTARTQEGALFTYPTSAAPFLLKAFADIFFKATNCMRADLSTCHPVGDAWYEATHHGLDAMMQRMLTEMKLLLQDSYNDLTLANSRYNAFYQIGISDLYDGLQTAAQLFVDFSVKSYQQVNMLQVIMLAVFVCVQALMVTFVLYPYLAMRKSELVEVAGLVSHVPQEVDATAHIKRIIRQNQNSHKKAAKPGNETGVGADSASADPKAGVASREGSSRPVMFLPRGLAKA